MLTTAKLDATGHKWVAALSNYTFSITYKPGKGHVDADALSCIKWPEAIDIDSQTVNAVCKGVQVSHGKVETLCQGAQAVDALCQDDASPGMTSLQWCQAKAKDPAIHQITDHIQNKTIKHLKIQGDMPSDLKGTHQIKETINIETRCSVEESNTHRCKA